MPTQFALAAATFALVGGTLVDGTGAPPVKDAVVVVSDGRVACAGTRAACPLPEGALRRDVSGRFVTPGLVDAHVHFSQTGWADGRPDAFDVRGRHPYEETEARLKREPERLLRTYACSGVTSVFDVGGYPWTLELPARADRVAMAPRVRAAGPLLSTRDHWLNLPAERQFIHLKDADAAHGGVTYLATQGASAVKVWFIVDTEHKVDTFAPFVASAAEEAKRRGLPLIVHATGLAEAKAALRAGAKLLVHGVGDLPVDEEFLALAKKAGTIYCPTITVFGGYLALARAFESGTPPVVDDPNGCVDAATRSLVAETEKPTGAARGSAALAARVQAVEKVGAANLLRVRDAGIPIAMGTDAGNPLTLHGVSVYAEMEAMQAAGMTPMQVLVSATRGGSLAMGVERETGTVEKGKAADLLVLDADPTADVRAFRSVREVFRAGVARNVRELRDPAR